MPETIIKKLTMHQKDANGNDIIMRPQTESSQIVDFNVAVNNLISQSQSGGNTNLTADDITAMIGYSKPNSTSNISTSDTLNQAIGKLEKALESVDTDTKVTNTLSNSTKFYVTGTSSSSTNTGTQYFDNGIYVTAESGKLHATSIETEGNLVIGGTADTNYIQLPSGIKLY